MGNEVESKFASRHGKSRPVEVDTFWIQQRVIFQLAEEMPHHSKGKEAANENSHCEILAKQSEI